MDAAARMSTMANLVTRRGSLIVFDLLSMP